MKKSIIILGATGSIGRTAIEVAKAHPDKLEVVGLQAHTQLDKLLELHQHFPQAQLALTGLEAVLHQKIFAGEQALERLISQSDATLVLNGIAGAQGLYASIYTLKNAKNLALANKESMVMAAEYLHALAKQHAVEILPVDSEHSALFYLMKSPLPISEYIITASGGAFRGKKHAELAHVTVTDALKHPTWKMGAKISIDSATLANKGLEVIEAWKLLHIPIEQIKVLQHPQSLVHALIRTKDGALQAYISNTDMTLAIQNALLHPQLCFSSASSLDLINKKLEFHDVDHNTFPMLNLAYQACYQGGAAPIIYNAANEVAVALFRESKIAFLAIAQLVEWVLKQPYPKAFDPLCLEHIWQADAYARQLAVRYFEENVQ